MKKAFALILAAALLLAALGTALAENSLPHRATPEPVITRFVDPAEILGQAGELFQQDYAFNGAQYDVYFYPAAEDASSFLEAWSAAMEENGFWLETDTIKGYSGVRFQGRVDGRIFAGLFFPEYDGEMMLMVLSSLNYVPEAAAASHETPEPTPESTPEPTAESPTAGWIEDYEVTFENNIATVDWSDFAASHAGGYTVNWVYPGNPDILYRCYYDGESFDTIAMVPGREVKIGLYYEPDVSVKLEDIPASESILPRTLTVPVRAEAPFDIDLESMEIGLYNEKNSFFVPTDALYDETSALNATFNGGSSDRVALRWNCACGVTASTPVCITYALTTPENYAFMFTRRVPLTAEDNRLDYIDTIYSTEDYEKYRDVAQGEYRVDVYVEGYPIASRTLTVGGAGDQPAATPEPTVTPEPTATPEPESTAEPASTASSGGHFTKRDTRTGSAAATPEPEPTAEPASTASSGGHFTKRDAEAGSASPAPSAAVPEGVDLSGL